MIVDVLDYFPLRCRSPRFRYFCTTETVGVNFTGFLIALAKMLLLRRRTFPTAGTILFCRWKNPVQNFDKLRKGFSHWQNGARSVKQGLAIFFKRQNRGRYKFVLHISMRVLTKSRSLARLVTCPNTVDP